MYKRILFVGPLFVLLMSAIWSCRPEIMEVKASQAVSTDAIVYVEKLSSSFFSEEFKQENILLKEINASDLSFISKGKFDFFNQIIRKITRLDDVGNSADLNVSLHLMGKDDICPVFYINTDAELSGDMLIKAFNGLYADIPENSIRTYDGMKIWEIQAGDENEYGNLSLAIIHGLLLVSDQSVLIEDAIRTFRSNSGISESDDFGVLAEVAGKYVQGNIYINFSRFPGLISKYLNLDKLQNSPFRGLFANMAEYDIDVDNERVILSGMATSSDSSVGIINAFRGQNSVKTEVIDHIPSIASEFKIFGISDLKLFRDELLLQLRYIDQLRNFENEDERLIRQGGESLFDIILNVMKDEVAWCKMDIGGKDDYSEIVFVKLKSRSEAIKQLERYWSKLVSSNQKREEDLMFKYHLDEQSVFDIYSFPDKYYQSTYLGNFFKKHFALYENYLILSDSENAISRTIYHNVLHKTLINDPAFKTVNDLIPSNINILIYKNPEQYFYSIEDAYSELIEKDAEKIAEVLNKIPALLVQFSYEDEKFYSSLAMHYSEGYNEATGTVWESLLDTVVKMKPVFVENHYTGEQEIIIQDANDYLYLINNTGRILWKKKLEGSILGNIFQVDYYKNGKLQYLFNTQKAIHLIDRNGNYVERYPVMLSSDATNGMALFDYDNRSDYRIFHAAEDKRIYVHNLEGNLVTGWTFDKTEGIVKSPIQHFRVGTKDYIVLKDNIRTYILNRRGEERVMLKKQFSASENNIYYLDMNVEEDNPMLVTSDKEGSIWSVDFSGNVKTVFSNKTTENHFFIYEDIDNDGAADYIFTDENVLKVFNSNGKRLFSFKIKSDISTMPDIYQFSSSVIKIGITDIMENEIYLLNADGSVYSGFPIAGSSRFTIGMLNGSENRFNLIVGNSDSFLYNYSVD